jgi:hypothetical protein
MGKSIHGSKGDPLPSLVGTELPGWMATDAISQVHKKQPPQKFLAQQKNVEYSEYAMMATV